MRATMFFGQYEHTIDDKNRVTLPARFRDALGDGLVLTKSFDTCLAVYSRADWDALVASRVAQLDPFSREARELTRYLFAGASDTELDKQGRVVIPPALAKHAGLGKDVVVAGVHDHLEIWDRTTWTDHETKVEGRADDVAERLADKR